MKYLIMLLFAFPLVAKAQLTKRQIDSLHEQAKRIDSTSIKINEMYAANKHFMDSLEAARMAQNMNGFVQQMQERNEKQKRAMYWRIAFGVAMLIVLVIGLLRKKKKPVN